MYFHLSPSTARIVATICLIVMVPVTEISNSWLLFKRDGGKVILGFLFKSESRSEYSLLVFIFIEFNNCISIQDIPRKLYHEN